MVVNSKNTVMNKKITFFALVLSLSLSWFGCNKSGKLNQSSEFKPPTGPVELKLKWPLGERVEQDMDMKMKMETTIPGQPTPMKQDMTMGQTYGLTVLQANPDGTHEIEMDFLTARMGMTMGEKSLVDYDPGRTSPIPWLTCSAKLSVQKSVIFWMPAMAWTGSKA
jgi:hypothetical protein